MTTPNQSRVILSEISDRTERSRLAVTPTRMLANEPTPANVLNNTFITDPFSYVQPSVASPDEIIIRQRGRRRKVKLNWSPDKCPMPSRYPFQKTPTKASTPMTLRSSPRIRLLEGLNFQRTPEKVNRSLPIIKLTPDSSLRSSRTAATPILKRLVLDDDTSTPQMKRIRADLEINEENSNESHRKIEARLGLMSHTQLVNIVLNMIKEDSQIEALVSQLAPKPDLSDFCDELKRIIRHINRCFPKLSNRYSASSSTIYPRVSSHIKEFKQTIRSQCTRLYNASEWDLLVDYHKLAWPLVRSLPVWDSAKQDNVRVQCFKFLCSMVLVALKNIGEQLGVARLEEFEGLLHMEAIDSKDVMQVIEEVREILGRIV